MTKYDHVVWLLRNQPSLTIREIASTVGCARSYVQLARKQVLGGIYNTLPPVRMEIGPWQYDEHGNRSRFIRGVEV